MKKWVTAVVVVAALAGAGLLVYWQWDPIWAFVFSPIGGFVTKILLTAKALKFVAGAAFAIGAGWVAVKRKLGRGAPEQPLPPPVYGPPEEARATGEAGAGAVEAEFTSAGTGTATTTETVTAPPSRPI